MNCRMLYVKQIVFKKVFAHELSNAVFIYKVSLILSGGRQTEFLL